MSLAAILAAIESFSGVGQTIANFISSLRAKATAAGASDADVQAAIDRGLAKVDTLDATIAAVEARLKAEGKL